LLKSSLIASRSEAYGEMKAAIVRRPASTKEFRHLSDPPEVLLPVFRAEAEVFVQAVPHIIAVEYESLYLLLKQSVL